jgi:flavin-dependent dehydrogenase
MQTFDVAILGGGPAGTAAALTLLTYSSRTVVVLERSSYDAQRPGEVVDASIDPLIRYLRAEATLGTSTRLQTFGVAAAWGSNSLVERPALFSGRSHSWHLDRAAFDRTLAEEVARRGGSVCTGAAVAAAMGEGGSWTVRIRREDEVDALRTRYVIAAAGRDGDVLREVAPPPRRVDQLVGLTAYLPTNFALPPMLIESCSFGWWYVAALPNNRCVVTLMTDADIAHTHRLHEPAEWREALASTIHARPLATEAADTIVTRLARSSVRSPACGPGWVAAGDSAASFDPLSSMGIGHALVSGIHAARCADAWLDGESEEISAYDSSVAATFSDYLHLRASYYAREQRWPHHPFWARRHAPTAGFH